MSENATLRVVSEHDVDEERVGEWVFANVHPGDRVDLIGSNGSVALVDHDQDVDVLEPADVEQAIEQVKP